MALPCAKDVAESSRASTAIGLSCILGASLLTIQVGSLDFGRSHIVHPGSGCGKKVQMDPNGCLSDLFFVDLYMSLVVGIL